MKNNWSRYVLFGAVACGGFVFGFSFSSFGDNTPGVAYKSLASPALQDTNQKPPTVTPMPIGHEYFIETLRNIPPQGRNFRVGRMISETSAYRKFAILYESGEFTISGVMNVPGGEVPENGFPVLILNHGLIAPSIYTTGRGSKREQDFFARKGYATIHPDYRGHASSSPNPEIHHDFYVSYSEDVSAVIDALKESRLDYLDVNRIGMWGHSMGGGITARMMVVRKDIKAFVLFAPVSGDVEDNFYELAPEEVVWLRTTHGPAGSEAYTKISPLAYFKDVSAPVQFHHGTKDREVPISFSQQMYDALKAYGKTAEFFSYPGEPHELINGWQTAANRSLAFFDQYVKE